MAQDKFGAGDRVIGNHGSFDTREGTVLERVPGRTSQYWVAFDDGVRECVLSHWIDALDAPAMHARA